MSNKSNQYIYYTEYYFITSAYHIINVVNEILTFSASCSDNFKGYLHSKVVSKQVEINEMARHENNSKKNSNGNDDVDEDGFVVIKMRKPRPKNARNINDETSANTLASTDNNVKTIKEIKESNIIKEIIEELIIEVASLY